MAYDLEQLVRLHNDARAKSWWTLRPVYARADLMKYAQDWAEQMARRGRLTHSPMRLKMGLGYPRAAENIAWNQKPEADVMRAWMGSWGHRANILHSAMDSIGVGVADSGRGPYWCACFAARK